MQHVDHSSNSWWDYKMYLMDFKIVVVIVSGKPEAYAS